jgi:hypothetical protein
MGCRRWWRRRRRCNISKSCFTALLENITQIEHKIPILNGAFCGGQGIGSLIIHTV